MRSLRTELFFIICLVGIVPSAIICLVLLKGAKSRSVSSLIHSAEIECMAEADRIYRSGIPEGTPQTEVDPGMSALAASYHGRVILADPDLRIIIDTYSKDEGKYIVSEKAARGIDGETVSYYNADEHYIEIVTPVRGQHKSDIVGVMLTSISTEGLEETFLAQERLAGILISAISLITAGAALFVASRIVSQFNILTKTIENIREGFTEEEISAFSYKETAGIMEAFNHILMRMRRLDNSRSEFVANVSHELKTPITSVKILAESLTAQDDVPNSIYREFMEDIVAEVDREDKIINDLLSLVRMDREGTNLSIDMCDMDTMIEGIIKRLTPIADRAGVEIEFETIRPVVAEVDETKLSLAITNVIENGIKYNHEGGTVKITLDSEPVMFTVTVEDTGTGIPEEDIPNIFERFYRVDKSHSRQIGGTGLGLAIARGAVVMHKGAIKVENRTDGGSRFVIRIPLRREGIV